MPPRSPTFLWNILPTGSSTPCGTPTNPTIAPGRATANAVPIESSVPTHSSTASAPTPPVISLTASAPSRPRSATMWVAPNAVASCCRPHGGTWR